ncbi:hypothetical protein [Dorea hominis]|uniref:hypothetical protein n=1 Tax=Dorea TaxID=189330 RepID=UPI000E4229DA|nr:hypothetical protein DW125_04550 [Dorea sp. AM10-31]
MIPTDYYVLTHSRNPTHYSHIAGLKSHFYAHIGASPKVLQPLMSKLLWLQTFWLWYHYFA